MRLPPGPSSEFSISSRVGPWRKCVVLVPILGCSWSKQGHCLPKMVFLVQTWYPLFKEGYFLFIMGPKRTLIGILGLFRGTFALQNRFLWLKWVILFVVPQLFHVHPIFFSFPKIFFCQKDLWINYQGMKYHPWQFLRLFSNQVSRIELILFPLVLYFFLLIGFNRSHLILRQL